MARQRYSEFALTMCLALVGSCLLAAFACFVVSVVYIPAPAGTTQSGDDDIPESNQEGGDLILEVSEGERGLTLTAPGLTLGTITIFLVAAIGLLVVTTKFCVRLEQQREDGGTSGEDDESSNH